MSAIRYVHAQGTPRPAEQKPSSVNPKPTVKDNARRTKVPTDEFIAGARRALLRACRKVRRENQRLGLPLISAKNGRVRLICLNGAR